jgi:hypothetical protein
MPNYKPLFLPLPLEIGIYLFLYGKTLIKWGSVLQFAMEQSGWLGTGNTLKETSTSAIITKQPFYMFNPLAGCKEPYEHTRIPPIPGAIDNYNHYISGVDVADQLRAGFTTQQRGVKP